MLKWFIEGKVLGRSFKRVQESTLLDVETRPERVPDVVLDECRCAIIWRFFFSMMLVVREVVKQKQENLGFICKICYHDLHEHRSVVCDHCLSWYHMKCVGLKQEPKARYWYCRDCHDCPFD